MFKSILLALTAVTVQGNKIICPKLTCYTIANTTEENNIQLPKNVCYEHKGDHPTSEIFANTCSAHASLHGEVSSDSTCDFNLLSNKYAWVDESTQHLKSTETIGTKS